MWYQVAAKYVNNDRIIVWHPSHCLLSKLTLPNQFGIMNEPHDLVSIADWADTVQTAVNAIRDAGAVHQYILMPGSGYSNAASLPIEAGPLLVHVSDPASNTPDKLLFDGECSSEYILRVTISMHIVSLVHMYLDIDYTGSHADCVRVRNILWTSSPCLLCQTE
jgi:hypothetical protein